MIINKVRILILFLTYGNRYKGSLEKFLGICELIKSEKRLIIIKNDLEDTCVRQINDWTFEIGGDNSVFEFSGWQRGIESEAARSFKPQMYLIANDAFLASGFHALPALDDDIINILYRNKLLAGHKTHYPIHDLSPYIQTHFFLVHSEIIEKLGSIVSENSSEKYLKPEHSDNIFTENEIWSETFKNFIYYFLTQRRHGKGLKLSSENYNIFKRKGLCMINEIFLSLRIKRLNYRIVDLTPFSNLGNSFYILNIPSRPIVPFQFLRKVVFSALYALLYNGYSKKMGMGEWFTKVCVANVKRNLLKNLDCKD
jgi:hypothetical protein